MICLIRITGTGLPSIRTCLNGNQSISVGRQDGVSLSLPDPYMSRRHLVVEGLKEGFRLRDLDSRNGTLLNGDSVSVAMLKSGDFIRAGMTTLEVEIREESYDTVELTPSVTGKQTRSQVVTDSNAGNTVPIPVDCDRDLKPTHTCISEVASLEAIGSGVYFTPLSVMPMMASTGEGQVVPESYFDAEAMLFPLSNACAEKGSVFYGFDVEKKTVPSVNGIIRVPSHGACGPEIPSPKSRLTEAAEIASSEGLSNAIDKRSEFATVVPKGLEKFGLQRYPAFAVDYGFVVRQAGSKAIELCEHLGLFYRLLLVVNRSQLDREGTDLLQDFMSQGITTVVTPTIYWVDGSKTLVPLLRLLKCSSRRDSVTCVGFHHVDRGYGQAIADLRHFLCYPSLLHSVLTSDRRDEAVIESLFRKVLFFLYEKGSTGDYYLFARRGFDVQETLGK
jgi:pSer/pThr/pTyr-binding forkhead associated (FHA) protein